MTFRMRPMSPSVILRDKDAVVVVDQYGNWRDVDQAVSRNFTGQDVVATDHLVTTRKKNATPDVR